MTPAEPKPCRVLLAEDDEGDAMLVREALAPHGGFELVHATNLSDALGRAESADIILTDLGLPDARGLEALDRFLDQVPQIPVVVLTGLHDEALGRRAVQRGAQEFVNKSSSQWPTLARTLRHSMERHSLKQRLQSMNEQLAALSVLDPLTEALNRRGFEQTLTKELSRTRRAGGTLAALLIDCDDFKSINDELGHAVGDAALTEIVGRIHDTMRSTDALGRIGGDEFLLLLPDTRLAEAGIAAERVRSAVSKSPLLLEPEEVEVTLSIGAISIPLSVTSLGELLAQARDALKASKSAGKDRVFLSTETGGPSQQNGSTELSSAVSSAVRGGGLLVLSQPLVALRTGRVAAYELLIRGPRGPFSSPTELMHHANDCGESSRVDLQCLKACFHRATEVEPSARVHLNLLPTTLLEASAETVIQLFSDRPDLEVCLELSEQQFIGPPGRLAEDCRRLREAGIRLAIDDIGTGRGTLDCVVLLEPDLVKIDMSLVHGAAADQQKCRLIGRLVCLADALNIDVVAEGIEGEADYRAMVELGVGFGQGYLWSRPKPLEDIVTEWPVEGENEYRIDNCS